MKRIHSEYLENNIGFNDFHVESWVIKYFSRKISKIVLSKSSISVSISTDESVDSRGDLVLVISVSLSPFYT